MSPAGRMGKQDPYPMWAPNKPLYRVQALGGVCGVGGGFIFCTHYYHGYSFSGSCNVLVYEHIPSHIQPHSLPRTRISPFPSCSLPHQLPTVDPSPGSTLHNNSLLLPIYTQCCSLPNLPFSRHPVSLLQGLLLPGPISTG